MCQRVRCAALEIARRRDWIYSSNICCVCYAADRIAAGAVFWMEVCGVFLLLLMYSQIGMIRAALLYLV